MNTAELASAIKRFVHDDASYNYLPQGTWWNEGGMLLALALRDLAQDEGRLVGIQHNAVIRHVGMFWKSLVFDAEGGDFPEVWVANFQEREDLLDCQITELPEPYIDYLQGRIRDLPAEGVSFEPSRIALVANILRNYLPSP